MESRFLILSLLCASLSFVSAQEALTPSGSLNFVKEVKPPILSVVQGSVRFVDATGNNAIDAGETCRVSFDIQNTGMGDAIGCIAKVAMKGCTSGISAESKRLPTIPVGSKQTVEIPLTADMQTITGQVTLTISVTEPLGFDIVPFDLAVHTRAFDAPLVKVADYALDGGVLEKNKPFDLQVAVQNIKSGDAEQVKVNMVVPQGVYLLSGNENLNYSTLSGGKAEMITYKIIVPTNYTASTIPVQINLRERYGKYAESRTIDLPLNQQIAQHTISIDEKITEPKTDVTQVTIGSDVDKNIPKTNKLNQNAFVLIIANENYKNVAKVPYALRDGEIFRQYTQLTLGIDPKHIKVYQNASFSEMLLAFDWIKQALTINPNAKAIIYYSGHGIPDEQSRSAYLLPCDGNSTNLRTAYKVDELYHDLGATNKSVTVFLDACFSGAKREGGMLASAKGVAIHVRPGEPQGKTVVFSAATGDETAGFYKSQQHGMFTYWLLKNLQTNADATYEQLFNSLYQQVRSSSFDENNKTQTPTVQCGVEAIDWRTWTLK